MWYINLRSETGPCASVKHVDDATVIFCDDPAGREISVAGRDLGSKDFGAFERALRDKTVIVVTHGFNVGFQDGLNSLAALAQYLNIEFGSRRDDFVIVGVLWPGDFNHLAVNYVWEHCDAVQAGLVLAEFLVRHFHYARLNFISHSLGARVVLSCLQSLDSAFRVDEVCLTAAAVDANAFKRQYAMAARRAKSFRILTSKADRTLMLAYPAGDFIADVFVGDGDSPIVPAMGRIGAHPPAAVSTDYAIPSTFLWLDSKPDRNFDHCDYFPNRTITEPPQPVGSVSKRRRKAAVAAGTVYDPRPEQAVKSHLARIMLGNWPTWPH